jgi:hypothetical protein
MAQRTTRNVGKTPMNAPTASTGPARIRLVTAAHKAPMDEDDGERGVRGLPLT